MIEEFCDIFWPQMAILAVVYMLVLAMVFLDLWSGVRKAKQRGQFRSSKGYRRTNIKVRQYFNAILCVTVIDVIQMLAVWQLNRQGGHHLPVIPLLTFGYAFFLGLIEVKSICEKAEDKEKAEAAEVIAMLGKALKDRDTRDIVASVIEYLGHDKTQHKDPPVIDRRFLHDSDLNQEQL